MTPKLEITLSGHMRVRHDIDSIAIGADAETCLQRGITRRRARIIADNIGSVDRLRLSVLRRRRA